MDGNVELCGIHQPGEPGEALLQAIGNLSPLLVRVLLCVLCEYRLQHCRNLRDYGRAGAVGPPPIGTADSGGRWSYRGLNFIRSRRTTASLFEYPCAWRRRPILGHIDEAVPDSLLSLLRVGDLEMVEPNVPKHNC